jgi:hypothetical protein
MPAADPLYDGTPVMATSYRQPGTISSIGKGGAAPYNTPFSGVMLPTCGKEKGQVCSVEKQSVPRCRQESTARMLGILAASEPLA